MANSQDGFTMIPNVLLKAMPYMRLAAYETSVFFMVLRKTYGYHKKMDKITNSQIVEATAINKTHVSRTISSLLNRRMLIKIGNLVGIQEDYELWLPKLPNQVTIDTTVTCIGNNSKEQLPNEVTAELPNEVTKLPNQVTKVTSRGNNQTGINKKENINKEKISIDINKKKRDSDKPNKYARQRYAHLVQS